MGSVYKARGCPASRLRARHPMIGARRPRGAATPRATGPREFPMAKLKLLASARAAGKRLTFRGQQITVEETTEASLEGADIVFCSATSAVSKRWGPYLRQHGAGMMDDGCASRM